MSLYLGNQSVQIASTVLKDIRLGEDLIQPVYFVNATEEDILKDYEFTNDAYNNYRLTKYIGSSENVTVPYVK